MKVIINIKDNIMKNRLLKNILLGTLLLFLGNSVMAQSVKDLEKQNKETINRLKKQNKLKKVEIRIEDDGFWYYLLRGASSIGVANQQGEIVVPVQYTDIKYYPALEEGVSYIPCYDTDEHRTLKTTYKSHYKIPAHLLSAIEKSPFALYHTASSAVWYVETSDDAYIYSIDGDVLRRLSLPVQYLPGYFFSKNSETEDPIVAKSSKYSRFIFVPFCSVYEQDGDLLVEEVFSASFNENKSLIYNRIIDGDNVNGGLLLNDTTSRVPCDFFDVFYDENSSAWQVRLSSLSEKELYIPGMDNKIKYRDKGEEYFEKGEYDNVIDFYSKEGISAPWAKFFIAQSFERKAGSHTVNCSTVTSAITGESTTHSSFVLDHQNDYFAFDLTQALDLYQIAIKYYDAYLQEDTLYEFTSDATLNRKTSLVMIAELPILQANYEKALKILEQRNEQARLAEIQQQQAAAQRKREVTAQIIGIFVNALSDAVSSSSQTGVSPVNNNYSGGSVGTSTSTSTSSSQSSRKTAHPRKCTSCAHVGNGKCRLCRGSGKYNTISDPVYRTCPHCNGTGKCQVCNGTGTTGQNYY